MIGNMSKKMKIAICSLLGVIAIIASGAAYYFLYYVKTPAYTCDVIAEAFEKHDIETVYKHVEIVYMLNRFADDWASYQTGLKEYPEYEEPAKRELISTFKTELDAVIMGQTWRTSPTNVFRNLNRDNISYVGYKKIDDDNAEIYLKFKMDGKTKDLTVKALHHTVDDAWHLYEVQDLYAITSGRK